MCLVYAKRIFSIHGHFGSIMTNQKQSNSVGTPCSDKTKHCWIHNNQVLAGEKNCLDVLKYGMINGKIVIVMIFG